MSLESLDKQAVEQFTRDFESLFNAGDAAGMAAFYAQDAKLLAESTELIQGRAAIEQFWRHAIERTRAAGAVRTISLDEVVSTGDLGYALGTVAVRIPHGPRMTTKYATIWQRDADGRWRLAVDSSSPNPAQSPCAASSSAPRTQRVQPSLCRPDGKPQVSEVALRKCADHRIGVESRRSVPSQFNRSRRRLSTRTGRPTARAIGSAVSRARRSGLLYSACSPIPCSHRAVTAAWPLPSSVSPGSPGTRSLSPCCTK
jgi:uncharacterized protein (TIGR02246 family)